MNRRKLSRWCTTWVLTRAVKKHTSRKYWLQRIDFQLRDRKKKRRTKNKKKKKKLSTSEHRWACVRFATVRRIDDKRSFDWFRHRRGRGEGGGRRSGQVKFDEFRFSFNCNEIFIIRGNGSRLWFSRWSTRTMLSRTIALETAINQSERGRDFVERVNNVWNGTIRVRTRGIWL